MEGTRGRGRHYDTEMSESGLEGKVVLVTGAAGDIGAAIAARVIALGALVAALDRDAAQVSARCVRELPECDRWIALGCDVADAEATRRAVDEAVARLGRLDVLVCAAATVTPRKPVAEQTADEWRRALDVNLTGAWLMAKWAIPHMRARGGGFIVNIASQLGHVTAPGRGAYSASKAGLIALTRSIAVDHAADGIRAVSVSPGAVMTSRVTDQYGSAAAANAALAGRHAIGRLGTAAEIAEVVAFLATGRVPFASGADWLVDGGYTAL